MNMVKYRSAVSAVALLAVVSAAGACTPGHVVPAASSHPDTYPAPLTDAQLGVRLLTDSDLTGSAWHVTAFPQPSVSSDSPGAVSASPMSTVDCSDMIDGVTFLKSAATPMASATEAIGGRGDGATTAGAIDQTSVQGAEMLYSYAGDNAHQAMAKVRKFVTDCSGPQNGTDMTMTFSLAQGATLGDESLVVRASDSLGGVGQFVSDTMIVRNGATLLVLTTLPTTEKSAVTMMSLGPAAIKKLSAR